MNLLLFDIENKGHEDVLVFAVDQNMLVAAVRVLPYVSDRAFSAVMSLKIGSWNLLEVWPKIHWGFCLEP